MVSNIDQRLLDTNALALGSGVGLAALEAMFNLVQTQSSLGVAMVKQHDTSHHTDLLTLAQILEAVLDNNPRSAPAFGSNKRTSVQHDNSLPMGVTAGVTAQMQTGSPSSMDQHLSELLDLLREHLADILQNSKSVLAVT